MEQKKICESEYRFLQVVWESEPVSSGRLVHLCAEKLGWKKPTTYTVLRKLCEKGFLQNEDSVVTSATPREAVQSFESEAFVERAFDGSLPRFLVSFLGGKTISDREAEELRLLIEAHRER